MASSSIRFSASRIAQTNNEDSKDPIVTINEKVSLTKQQHEVLKIICDAYETSLSEYTQQALLEAMRFDIEEGNLCDALLEKIGAEDSKSTIILLLRLLLLLLLLLTLPAVI